MYSRLSSNGIPLGDLNAKHRTDLIASRKGNRANRTTSTARTPFLVNFYNDANQSIKETGRAGIILIDESKRVQLSTRLPFYFFKSTMQSYDY